MTISTPGGVKPGGLRFAGAMLGPLQRPRAGTALATLLVPLGLACGEPSITEDPDPDPDTKSSPSGGDEIPLPPPETGGADSTTGRPDETTGGVHATTTGTDSGSDESAGFLPRPDGGSAPAGICIGVSQVGHLATVLRSGPDPVDPTCDPTPAPCAGDIVGTWTIDAHCGLAAFPGLFDDECPGSVSTVLATSVEGTRTFGADSTFSTDSVLTIDLELLIDAPACYGIDCETFADALTQPDNNLTAACVTNEDDEACTCAATIENQRDDVGTYELTDEGLVLTTEAGSADPVPVCAVGDRLQTWEALTDSQVFVDTLCDEPADCQAALGDAYEQWLCIR